MDFMLSVLIFLPIVLALILWGLPKRFANYVPQAAFGFAFLEFLYSILILCQFDKGTADLQMVENWPWIGSLGISYFIGIDGISLPLVILTTFILPLMILGSWSMVKSRAFYMHLFVLEGLMLGSFLALDAILFYTFFEASLIPMYFLIGIWGGPRRLYATVKFFVFTMFGSVLMLVAIISMMFMAHVQLGYLTASILDFYQLQIPFVANLWLDPQTLLFLAFSLAFAIKMPLFPVHTWLPDAHVEAPTAGSVVLASVMLKMGSYGFLRWVIPLFPEAVAYMGWIFLALGVIGIVYGACMAMVQSDIKKLVAYSSVSHLGYVMVGLFALNTYGLTGSLYQMLNHGVSTGALFLLVGMIYERTHSRKIKNYGGLASVMPVYAILFFIILLSSIAVPGTNGFVGELLILMGGFIKSPVIGVIAVLGVILGAIYMLWMFKMVFLGEKGLLVKKLIADQKKGSLKCLDLSWREIMTLVPLIILVFWMGIFPNTFFDWSRASIEHLVNSPKTYQLDIVQKAKKQRGQQASLREIANDFKNGFKAEKFTLRKTKDENK